jgi:hypothetical protein
MPLPCQTLDQIHHAFAGHIPAVLDDDMGAQLDHQTVGFGEGGAAAGRGRAHAKGLTLPWPWFVW